MRKQFAGNRAYDVRGLLTEEEGTEEGEMISDHMKYVIAVCDTIIDDEVNRRNRKKGWINVLELMQGVAELKERLNRWEDDGK